MSPPQQWVIGLEVNVAPRTWPGINKPGGHGKIVKIHFSSLGVVDSLDIRYTLDKKVDTNLETDLVKPHVELDRGRRSRRKRDFFASVFHEDLPIKNPYRPPNKAKQPEHPEKENDASQGNHVKGGTKKMTPAATKGPTKEEDPPKKQGKRMAKSSQPRGQAPPPQPKKRSKPDKKTQGQPAAAVASSTKTEKPESPKKRKAAVKVKGDSSESPFAGSVPEFVVTKPAASCGTLSPLVCVTGVNNGGDGTGNNNSPATKLASVSAEEDMAPTTTSAQALGVSSSAADHLDNNNGQRKTLKNVYDDQVQEAAGYIDSLVGRGPTAEQRQAAKSMPPEEPQHDDRRFQAFCHIFWKVIMVNEVLAEDDWVNEVNSGIPSSQYTKSKPFNREETEQFVDRLCAEGKGMRSEGYFYPI